MFGYLSINLENEILDYINQKKLIIGLDINKPININNYGKIIDKVIDQNITNLIVDETIFYEQSLILSFIFEVKKRSNINVIYIAFKKDNIKKLIQYNIYNVIYFPSCKNLSKELDEILIKPKTIIDLNNLILAEEKKEFYDIPEHLLNIAIIANRPNIGSTFVAENISYGISKKFYVNYIENPYQKSNLRNYYKANNFSTIQQLDDNFFRKGHINYIFSANQQNFSEEVKIKLLQKLSENSNVNVFDFGVDYINYQAELHMFSKIIDIFILVVDYDARKDNIEFLQNLNHFFAGKKYIVIENKNHKYKDHNYHVDFMIPEYEKDQIKKASLSQNIFNEINKTPEIDQIVNKLLNNLDKTDINIKESKIKYFIKKLKNPLK